MSPAWFIGLLIPIVTAATLILHIRRRALDRLRQRFKQELRDLLETVKNWKGSEFDLVPQDTERTPSSSRGSRTFLITPQAGVVWGIWVKSDGRFRLELDRSGQPKQYFPGPFGWSDESWIMDAITFLLEEIRTLPPPRSYQEWCQTIPPGARARMEARDAAALRKLDATAARLGWPPFGKPPR